MTKYPLEQLSLIKKKKLEEAEKILRKKKELLAEEEKKQKTLEEERDKVRTHKDQKLAQMREALDSGTSTNKIEQMRQYLKVVKENLKGKQKKVDDQIKRVKEAEKEVDKARVQMIEKQKQVEKLSEHHKEWQKGARREIEKKDEEISDEISTAKHITKKKRRTHE